MHSTLLNGKDTVSLSEMVHCIYLQIYFCNMLLIMRMKRNMKAKCVQMELESSTLLGAQFPLWLGLIMCLEGIIK